MEREAVCPGCGESFEVESTIEVGDSIWCERCYCELQVFGTNPLRFEVL